MVKVELNKDEEWEVLEDDSPNGIYIDGYLKEKLDNILEIQRKKWDAVFIIDGRERSGKSTLGMTCAWYLSRKKLTINNFARGSDDVKKKIQILPDGSVIMVDESSLVFNSKDSTKRENVELQKIMDVIGQKNMIFIMVLPSIFDLSKSLATRRSLFLLHIFVDRNWKRGVFGYYGEEKKEVLYIDGKKNYNKYTISPEFRGNFTKFEPPFYQEYLKLKEDTLAIAMSGKEDNKDKTEIKKLKAIINRLVLHPPTKQLERSKIVGVTIRNIRNWEDGSLVKSVAV